MITATRYAIHALETATAERLRTAKVDDYGNEVIARAEIGPCRHCLRSSVRGERLVLVSFSPFEIRNPYKEVGPIFLHADGCERYTGADLPEAFATKPLVLRAYDYDQIIYRPEMVVDGTQEERIVALLADEKVAYIHARSFTSGCYLFRIDRAGE
ncbi:MAG: DUF1203 domain-containing protein [Candidatus Eremiobacteraeota bacterium]|nr:DUF1203 domain-containing protein [Candidatus Eremiobacteraeota bacterium]